jgi:uncharacterized glyoxalase superfamily protein PhnB
MRGPVAHVPPVGYPTLCPYLVTPQADALVGFVTAVFDARLSRAPVRSDEGRLVHAELAMGESMLMLAAPEDGETVINAMLHVYVADCDATYTAALAERAEPIEPPAARGNGDRRGGFRDPAGNVWFVATPASKAHA